MWPVAPPNFSSGGSTGMRTHGRPFRPYTWFESSFTQSVSFQNISATVACNTRSQEELRWEDYQAGVKSSSAAPFTFAGKKAAATAPAAANRFGVNNSGNPFPVFPANNPSAAAAFVPAAAGQFGVNSSPAATNSFSSAFGSSAGSCSSSRAGSRAQEQQERRQQQQQQQPLWQNVQGGQQQQPQQQQPQQQQPRQQQQTVGADQQLHEVLQRLSTLLSANAVPAAGNVAAACNGSSGTAGGSNNSDAYCSGFAAQQRREPDSLLDMQQGLLQGSKLPRKYQQQQQQQQHSQLQLGQQQGLLSIQADYERADFGTAAAAAAGPAEHPAAEGAPSAAAVAAAAAAAEQAALKQGYKVFGNPSFTLTATDGTQQQQQQQQQQQPEFGHIVTAAAADAGEAELGAAAAAGADAAALETASCMDSMPAASQDVNKAKQKARRQQQQQQQQRNHQLKVQQRLAAQLQLQRVQDSCTLAGAAVATGVSSSAEPEDGKAKKMKRRIYET